MLPIDVVLTEQQLADEFVSALARRDLPEKFLYWFPLSVRAWLALCGEGPYRNYSRSHEVIERHAAEVAALAPKGAVEVVSLGAGQGDKDRSILAALAASGREIRYRPVDASVGLLELAVGGARAAGFTTRGVKADFTDAAQLDAVASARSTPRLYMLLGNTLGGFDPEGVATSLAHVMQAEDVAIVDGELFAGRETLAGYDNPLNRRFAFGPLAGAGLTEADGALVFELEEDERRRGLHRVVKHFTAARSATMTAAGERLTLGAGERFLMSPSHKYDEPAYFGVLEDAGLQPVTTFRSVDGRFLMTVVRRALR